MVDRVGRFFNTVLFWHDCASLQMFVPVFGWKFVEAADDHENDTSRERLCPLLIASYCLLLARVDRTCHLLLSDAKHSALR